MKKILKFTVLIYLFSFFNTLKAAEIEACNTSDCISYFKEYKKKAKLGYAEAMTTLAEFYYYGYGTDKNLSSALKYYKRAARYGSIRAQGKTGFLYLTEPELLDHDKGVKYFQQAARNKHSDSAFILGVIYSSKDFGFYDTTEADKWLTKSYELKNTNVRSFINKLHQENNLNNSHYPKVTEIISSLSSNNKQKNNALISNVDTNISKQIQWPNDEMEVIAVSSPVLADFLNSELASFKNAYPEQFAKTTGTSLIARRSCDKTVSCSQMSKGDLKRIMNKFIGKL